MLPAVEALDDTDPSFVQRAKRNKQKNNLAFVRSSAWTHIFTIVCVCVCARAQFCMFICVHVGVAYLPATRKSTITMSATSERSCLIRFSKKSLLF